MEDNGKTREKEFTDALIRAFGRECIYHSPQMRKASGQQKELADALILVPPYAVVFQLKWLHQSAEDFYGDKKDIEQNRLEQKMIAAARQFKRLHSGWRQGTKIELPQVWNTQSRKNYSLDLSIIEHFIPVVVVDFEDSQYEIAGGRTNVSPIVVQSPNAIKEWGMVHCFLFKDFLRILDDLFEPGDLMTYLTLRERQITESQRFINYSELDFFALYLSKYNEWNRTQDSPYLLVEPNYYEDFLETCKDEITKRRRVLKQEDSLDKIMAQMCSHSHVGIIPSIVRNIGQIKSLPALLKKDISHHLDCNLAKLSIARANNKTQISIGRFPTVLSPNTVYLIAAVLYELQYSEAVIEILYQRTLSYMVANGWRNEKQDVFIVIKDLDGRWAFVGYRRPTATDYDNCLQPKELEETRTDFNLELFRETEWSYSRHCQAT